MINEGTGMQRLGTLMSRLGYNEFDRWSLATIVSTSPTIVRVDGFSLDLDANDLVIAEHLTDHTRTITINGGEEAEMFVKSPLQPGDRVIVASMSGGQFYVVIDKAVMI